MDRFEIGKVKELIYTEVAREWVSRGGSELHPAVRLFLFCVNETLAPMVREESTYRYDENGMPQRLSKGQIGYGADIAAMKVVRESVAGKLPFAAQTWNDLDVYQLITRGIETARLEIDQRRAAARLEEIRTRELVRAAGKLSEWQRLHLPPLISPYGLNPDEAEHWICQWLLHMGATGAATTQFVSDGGIDVLADNYIAQVKMYAGTVGIAAVREFAGVAALDSEKRKPLFFTTGRYPSAAPTLADRAQMALFRFDLTTGEVTGTNKLGEEYAQNGFLGTY